MANLTTAYEKLKEKNPKARITQSYLRSDVILGTAQTINFALLANQAMISAKEIRLQMSDAFCVTAWTIKLYKSADTAAPLTAANVAKAIDYNYPQPAVFTASNEAANLENIYNSSMQVTINKNVIFSAYPCYKFRRVNQSQLGTTTAVLAGPTAYTIASEQQAGVDNGLVGLTPTFNLQGAWNMQFTLNCPASTAMAGTSSTNVVSLILEGFLLQNAAQYFFPE